MFQDLLSNIEFVMYAEKSQIAPLSVSLQQLLSFNA